MSRAITLILGTVLTAGIGVHAQVPPSQAIRAPKAAANAVADSSGAQSAQPTKPAGKPAPKSATKSTATKAKKSSGGAGASSTGAPAPEAKVARRDPFESLIGHEKAAAEVAKNLPPGKAGLQVASLRLDGIVRAPNGMIAVVTNPQSRTYFLREGDQLYDGRVEKIAMDGVSFHEIGKDAFGKPVERQVNKRIYSSAGEQQ
jgi:type IV pilus assembly protein PilP